jgi:hypothetical protein
VRSWGKLVFSKKILYNQSIMTLEQANERIMQFFRGENLTFCVERFGENSEEWVAYCDQIPGITTSGYGFDEREMKELVRDAILTAAGVDGEFSNDVMKELSFKSAFAVSH